MLLQELQHSELVYEVRTTAFTKSRPYSLDNRAAWHAGGAVWGPVCIIDINAPAPAADWLALH